MTHEQGSITLIIGPMFGSKTTRLMAYSNKFSVVGYNSIIIKYCGDNRYTDKPLLITHDGQKLTATLISKGNSLERTLKDIDLASIQCVLIDEVQFYDDAPEICDSLANMGKKVICAGLQGDFRREPFPVISQLISKADVIEHVCAVSKNTGGDAPFTARKTNKNGPKIIVGGADLYCAVNRFEWNAINNQTDNNL